MYSKWTYSVLYVQYVQYMYTYMYGLVHAAQTCLDTGMPVKIQSGIVSFPLVYNA
jgi:hypothetical protein